MPVHRVGQTGVGLRDHGQARAAAERCEDVRQLIRPDRAVYADRVRAEALECARHGFHGAAREGAPALLKAHRHEHGQGSGLLHGQQRRLRLVEIAHRLDHGEIRPGLLSGLGDLREELIGRFKRARPHGLEQLAEGANVERDLRAVVCGVLRKAHRGGDNLVHGSADAL